MNNYNELMNKPRINHKELIGDVEIPIPSAEDILPKLTNADDGKVLTADHKSWIAKTPSDFNMATYETTCGFFTKSVNGVVMKVPIYQITIDLGDDETFTGGDWRNVVEHLGLYKYVFKAFLISEDGNGCNVDISCDDETYLQIYPYRTIKGRYLTFNYLKNSL